MAKADDKKPEAEAAEPVAKAAEAKVDESAKVQAQAEASTLGLVKMRKGDQVIYVHPTCVSDHEKAEWEVC